MHKNSQIVMNIKILKDNNAQNHIIEKLENFSFILLSHYTYENY